MKSTKISDSVLKQIKTQKIAPKAKWKFLAKNVLFWVLFGLSVLFSAIGVSVVIFAFMETDFDLFSYLGGSGMQRILSLLPIFWLLLFAIFVGVALFGFRKTKGGYRFSVSRLLLINVILGIFLGTICYNLGGAEQFENIFANNVRFYHGIRDQRIKRWARPEGGRLAGEIIEMKNDKIFLLNDFDQKEWIVDAKNLIQEPFFDLKSGMKVRMIGKEVSKNKFKAEIIQPWRRRPEIGLKRPRGFNEERGRMLSPRSFMDKEKFLERNMAKPLE